MAFSDDVPSVGNCAVSPIGVSDRSSPTANALWPSAPAARSAHCGPPRGGQNPCRIGYSARLEVDAVVQAPIVAAVDVLVDPALPLCQQLGSFVAPMSVGRPPGLYGMDAAIEQPADAIG